MIVHKRAGFLTLLFTMRGSVVPRVLPQMILLALFSSGVVFVYQYHTFELPEFSLTPFTLLGIALSLFLGFRNNAAYDRWWEGRKLWGSLVYETRAMGRATELLLLPEESRKPLLKLTAAFSHTLCLSLRPGSDSGPAIASLLDAPTTARLMQSANPSDAVLREMTTIITREHQQGRLDTVAVSMLDKHLTAMAGIQAGLERLANTPMPFAFTLLAHRTAYIYCFLLPLGLVGNALWLTPFFTTLVAYCFFGLDALSEELEYPFTKEGANHLPLEAMCRVNEISVAEALGDEPPKPLQPIKHILS
ncbi:bestrophin family ion channel [Oceanospirillum sp. HFRX-1_2]